MNSIIALAVAAIAAAGPAPRHAGPMPHQVTVVATDFHLALPDTLAAGATEFRVENRGREVHHVTLVRLEGGKTPADFAAALKAGGPPPSWAVELGGPNAVDPGATSLPTTVTLTPGHYLALCVIPSPDHVPHVMKGMVTAFVVTPARLAAAPDTSADATVTLVDYGFDISHPITSRTHRIRVINTGRQPHELVLVRLQPGTTVAEVGAWAEKMDGPPPARFLGGVSVIDPGQVNELSVSLQPGHYAMLCFVPDTGDGKPHIAHGMARAFEVK